jgi:hypothetical protein
MKPNRKHIKFIAAPQGSAEWLALRQNGLGGSEIGGVLGQSDYMDPIKVYLNKIGEAETFKGNRFTRMGKLLEDLIAYMYCYWDPESPDCETMLINEESGKKFRKVERVNGYITNEKYPWLYASLDRKIRGDKRGRGHLETKNTTGMEKNRYTHGFNPSFYCQIQQYLLLDEADYTDVAIYYDGNNFDVKPVYPDKEVQEIIIEKSKEFWVKVLQARAIKEHYGIGSYYGHHLDFIPEEQRAGVYDLMKLEPELTGTENEYKFLQDLVKPTPEYTEMPGTEEQLDLVHQYLRAGADKKKANTLQTAIKEKLVVSLGGYHQATWGPKESISYKPTTKGNRFRVSPALDPDASEEA